MIFKNPNATHTPYDIELAKVLNKEAAQKSKQWLSSWPLLNSSATPLWSLAGTADDLGIETLWIKDESKRSKLGSFKALGAPNALINLVLKHFPTLEAEKILLGEYRELLADFAVVSATDGNHGRALAAAAQSSGCPCTIVIHAQVSQEREEAIAEYGATMVRITGNYDESVEEADRIAKNNGWIVVSDTSYDGYTEIPRDVMQGYGVMAAETAEQLGALEQKPTHIVLQGGVGGLAAGVFSYFWEQYGTERPTFIVVEPSQADCLYQSAIQGKPSSATGSVDSVMAGLACGKTSKIAWDFLQPSVDYFTLIEDQEAIDSMVHLAHGKYDDTPIVGGESGVAGLALLTKLAKQNQLEALGLDADSKVLIVNTEGATAPGLFEELTDITVEEIIAKQ
ncbi:diaminopropionate ammonia-lyase [Vibrio sp. S4M6]|uniref:diaminopropionate ammonia-lyase n=1 Tax=Vibrio sinus TaxID=2946865 RepID=UPI002029CC10|nr:diaminopropionate ammonia-lyase [Vibrio sinus]MCL9780638.1 diaminopropionate ammonia-lyase [Vibrio sinus]